MLFREIEVGDHLRDRWYTNWGVAVVEWKGKTSVRLKWPDRTLVYDRTHCRFLEKVPYESL